MSARSDQEVAGALLHLLAGASRPLSVPRLLGLLGLRATARRRLRRILQDLARQGRIESERGRYRAAAGRKLEGILQPGEGTLPWLETDDGRCTGPLWLGPAGWAGAVVGDRVVLTLFGRSGDRLRARVERVLCRGSLLHVGRVATVAGRRQVVLLDSGGAALPLGLPAPELPDGVYVSVSVQGGSIPVCRLETALGRPGTLQGEMARLLCEAGLDGDFPGAAEAEAAAGADRRRVAARKDLRDRPFVTIDPDDARDFDDAVCAERVKSGFLLRVAIADVSAFVTPDGAIEREAARRGTSVYFPGSVVPMLPRRLSESLCCLSPGQERAALVAELILRGGECAGGRLFPALIQSRRRFSYAEAQDILDGRAACDAELGHQLHTLADCAAELWHRMNERGALDLDLPESDIRLDDEGRPVAVAPAVRHGTCRIIEACMVAANEAVARLLRDSGLPALYRVHRPPAPQSMRIFAETARALGLRLRLPREPVPADLARVVREMSAHPAGRFLHGPLLRSLMPAEYSASCEMHFGLASPAYLHFTSPIRRFPDLMVHRQLEALLESAGPEGVDLAHPPRGGKSRFDGRIADRAARAATRLERRAAQAERQARWLYHAAFLAERIGETFEGRVCAVSEAGLFVRLEPSGIEGLLRREVLGKGWRYDEGRIRYARRGERPALTLGSPLRTRVIRADLESRRVELDWVFGGSA
ncbi:MAG: RNB domain-containing ribonuclease [Myxococcales bacterium]|nr:RNB domain-containing ribonuclease [Myxococcales bacterium]